MNISNNSSKLKKGILLAVLAHPDDESYGPGATLAKYGRLGVSVHYAVATKGEEGSAPSELVKQFTSIADMRWSELKDAAKALKLRNIYCLGYWDSGMHGSTSNKYPNALIRQSVREVAVKISRIMNKIKPHVVITHDPIGDYQHSDHIMIHKATVMAFRKLTYQPRKLYYPFISRRLIKFGVKVLPFIGIDPKHYGQNKDIDLTSFADVDFPIHAVINVSGEPTRMKNKAISCHRSQHWNSRQGTIIDAFLNVLPKNDLFTRAYPAVTGTLHETDLFEGIFSNHQERHS